jgi:sec-independent protein translocase protein TatA
LLLLIVLLLFGTRRLRNIGGDLGSAIRSFRSAMNDSEPPSTEAKTKEPESIQDQQDKPG